MTSNWARSTTRGGRIVRLAGSHRSWSLPRIALLIVAASLAPAPLSAQPEPWTPPPHVRPERDVRPLVEEAARRSPLIRELIEQLEDLDVIVYIRVRPFQSAGLDGRIALLAAAGGRRYLVIELACERNGVTQMATLGHELYHATEIARERSVVSPGTLAALYQRIGQQTGDGGGLRTFETAAAAAAGLLARRQLLTATARNGHGT